MTTELIQELTKIDGRSYGAYKNLQGKVFNLGKYRIRFDHIQGDPFASPSRIRVDVPAEVPALEMSYRASPHARRATADFLHRRVRETLQRHRKHSGSGKSGLIEIASLGQEVFDRTAVRVREDGRVVLRLFIGLPAAGRRILGRAAVELLTHHLPGRLDDSIAGPSLERDRLETHVKIVEDQVALREALDRHGLVAFLAENSVLPRRSGADDRPMKQAVPLKVPESLLVEIDAPHAGRIRGLGIPKGITLIVGGGYHGKSTLLDALARNIYDHIPGDGRERCVTRSGAVTIRAEDGRSVRGVDLRPFIRDLPLGRKTDCFNTEDASGSTSQAAAIIEALETGADILLIDEDTAATNFMIRDARMRRLVPPEMEPITPFLDRVRQLFRDRGISSVLVVGGAGDYLDVADTVIQMKEYRPADVTPQAKKIAAALPLGESAPQPPGPWPTAGPRIPDPASLDPSRGKKRERVRSVKTRSIEFGTEEIDVSLLDQLVDPSQCRMIGDVLLRLARGLCDGRTPLPDLMDRVEHLIREKGLEGVVESTWGDRAMARRFEIAAALNRMRALRLKHP